jgi:hypothetical protein
MASGFDAEFEESKGVEQLIIKAIAEGKLFHVAHEELSPKMKPKPIELVYSTCDKMALAMREKVQQELLGANVNDRLETRAEYNQVETPRDLKTDKRYHMNRHIYTVKTMTEVHGKHQRKMH